jgi:hypothetical protein
LYQPKIATADGSVIATAEDGTPVIFDQTGSITGFLASLPVQSWTGNEYLLSPSGGSVESVVEPVIFEDGANFWPTSGGNPSGNGTAIVQCPCLLQTALETELENTTASSTWTRSSRTTVVPPVPSETQKTYLLMVGDSGLNLGPGHNHSVGGLFARAAETAAINLTQSGNNTVITKRVSSVSGFNGALTTNGMIDGDVTFFGHGGVDSHGNYALFPGQNPGDANNISAINVGQLSNAYLGSAVTITLNACHAGLGGRRSIAQLIANQLQRPVLAYPVDMYFSADPAPRRFRKGMTAPTGVPAYMVPNGDGIQPVRFLPR